MLMSDGGFHSKLGSSTLVIIYLALPPLNLKALEIHALSLRGVGPLCPKILPGQQGKINLDKAFQLLVASFGGIFALRLATDIF